MNKLKIVIVEWVDSSFSEGWVGKDEFDYGISYITSVGYLVHETKEFISIALNVGNNGQISDVMNIPKVAILSITDLKLGNKIMQK